MRRRRRWQPRFTAPSAAPSCARASCIPITSRSCAPCDSGLGDPAPELTLDDSDQFLKALPGLDVAERRVVLRVLAVAAILDGRLVRAERRLLAEAYHAAELPSGVEHVEQLRRWFIAGDIIPHDELRRAAA